MTDNEKEMRDLELHVLLCAERHKAIERRFQHLEDNVNSLHEQIKEDYQGLDAGLKSIRAALEDYKTKQFNRLLGWAGTLITILGTGLVWALVRLLNLS